MNDIITIRGQRDLWITFVYKAKQNRKQVWDVLTPFLHKYIQSDEDTRVLLLLCPEEVGKLVLKQEDPDRFIEEAIREHLNRCA